MEHEVRVPVSGERVRAALADPARVARALPGLQQEAGAEPVAGRLKVRIGGTTITYRGTASVTAREDGTYAVEGEAVESRGTGAVKFALTLSVRDTEDGAVVAFSGTGTVDGRAAALPDDAVATAVTRLLNRFAEQLDGGEPAEAPEEGPEEGPTAGEPSGAGTEGGAEDTESAAEVSASVFETEVPASSLDPLADDVEDPDGPPAEAAHARRTMIGRSAEEVDHAPPRGRYAPVPAPQTIAQGSTLRWAAPAAALVVATVIVAGRALRHRRRF
ncbi:SRPBCC domain-containing protein [Streptomyces sp. NPDC058739]|uniref:SRPBCC domain-containing protein n=1 Tax=Streptomyces sp. NPDC058739 TaxID=3346618 RepID=UPI0036D03819